MVDVQTTEEKLEKINKKSSERKKETQKWFYRWETCVRRGTRRLKRGGRL